MRPQVVWQLCERAVSVVPLAVAKAESAGSATSWLSANPWRQGRLLTYVYLHDNDPGLGPDS